MREALRRTRLVGIFTLTALGAFLAQGLWAEPATGPEPTLEESQAIPTANAEPRGLPVSIAGMQVYIDPKTGRLRPPTAEERAELSAALRATFGSKSSLGHSEPVQHKSGAYQSVVLDTSYLNFSMAHITTDGAVHTDCVSSPEQAMALIDTTEVTDAPKTHDGVPVE